MEILTRKFISDSGVRCREVLEFWGFNEVFPSSLSTRNKPYMDTTMMGYHVFDDSVGKIHWVNLEGGDRRVVLRMEKPADVKTTDEIGFAGVQIGSTWSEEMFQAIVRDIKKERDKILAEWSGEETVEI